MTIDKILKRFRQHVSGGVMSDTPYRMSFDEAKAELQKLMAAERLDELKHLNPNDDDSWLEDLEQYERDGSSPVKYVDERIAELKAKASGE